MSGSGSTSTATTSLLESARAALALAKKHGADNASATAQLSREIETTWRDGKIEKVSEAASRSIDLALFVDGRFGSMSTSDLRPAALERFVQDALGLVRSLAKDPHRKLPDPSSYAGRFAGDLEIFDPQVESRAPDARIAIVKAIEEGARSVKGADRIVSVTTTLWDGSYATARATTNGFEGAFRTTYTSTSASSSVKDDDGRRPEDWASADVRFAADLPDGAAVGREATERALGRLGAKKIKSGTMNIVVEARVVRQLLGHLTSPLGGWALQQKQSFLDGKLEKAIGSKLFTLTDEPLLKRGIASRPFDGEGMSTKTRPLIEAGVLKSYLLDVYYANKLGMRPTTGRLTNLIVAPGKLSLAALLKQMKDGIFVTSFLGGNSISTTGAFSLGVSGFRVAGGEKKEPIAEMNIAGTHLELWKKLAAVGDDPYPYNATRSPSLLFEGVSVAGS